MTTLPKRPDGGIDWRALKLSDDHVFVPGHKTMSPFEFAKAAYIAALKRCVEWHETEAQRQVVTDPLIRGSERETTYWHHMESADEIERLEKHIGNLLARIHRDGGHYQAQHGTERAVQDAEKICSDWAEVLASRDEENARLERELVEAKKSRSAFQQLLAESEAQCAAMRGALEKCKGIATDYLVRGTYQYQLHLIQKECVSALSPDAGAKVLRVVEAAKKGRPFFEIDDESKWRGIVG